MAASSSASGNYKTQNPKEEERLVGHPGSSVSANDSGVQGGQSSYVTCDFRNLDGSRCTEFAEYEVPVWDAQPVPGVEPKGANQAAARGA